jgi:DNA end-binding protein Ku
MSDTKRAALAQVVMSSREHVALIRVRDGVLVMSLLSYQQELQDADEFQDAAPKMVLPANELKMAKLLTEAMGLEEVNLADYRDRYADGLREIIDAKVKGQGTVRVATADLGPRVINLMDALEKSLAKAKEPKSTKRRKAS